MDVIERLKIQAYSPKPRCVKCGNTNLRPRYDVQRDTVFWMCVCGYQWETLPFESMDMERPNGRPAKKKG